MKGLVVSLWPFDLSHFQASPEQNMGARWEVPTQVLVVCLLLALKVQQAVPTPELVHAHRAHGLLVCLAVLHQEVADADAAAWHTRQARAPWTAWCTYGRRKRERAAPFTAALQKPGYPAVQGSFQVRLAPLLSFPRCWRCLLRSGDYWEGFDLHFVLSSMK